MAADGDSVTPATGSSTLWPPGRTALVSSTGMSTALVSSTGMSARPLWALHPALSAVRAD